MATEVNARPGLRPYGRRTPSLGRSLVAALAVAAFLLLPASADAAAASDVQLSLRPIGVEGQYFDLTMQPGESRTLEVELGNVGQSPVAVRTYAADVYTIINGGFGAELRDEPASGTTLWLDYPSEVFQLPPGQGIRRTFAVRVPPDAAPGEYIASVILENDVPIRGSGDVAIDQVVRQALAVVITLPGPRSPSLAIGAASHMIVADKSVVAVAVRNTGNVRLKPVAEFVLRDDSGATVSETTLVMDSFYAGTETLVEVPLAALLQPGAYSVGLSLEDPAQRARAEGSAVPHTGEPPPAPHPGGGGIVPQLTEVIQSVQEGRAPLVLLAAVLAGSLLIGVVVGLLILAFVRRRRRRRDRLPVVRPDAR